MRKDKKLEDDEVIFKAIEEEETRIKAKHKASANFASTKSNAAEGKDFDEWQKCKKCGCKHLAAYLPSYGKGTFLLLLNNGFLKLTNAWYAPDLDFKLISTISARQKGVEM